MCVCVSGRRDIHTLKQQKYRTLQLGTTSFTFLPMPHTVPPVPAPHTIISTFPVQLAVVLIILVDHGCMCMCALKWCAKIHFVNKYTYIAMYICMCMHTHARTHTHTSMRTHIRTHTYTHMYNTSSLSNDLIPCAIIMSQWVTSIAILLVHTCKP